MAIPPFVGAGTFVSGSGSVTPGLPAGLASGDLMIMLLQTANEAVPATPTGYAGEIPGSPQGIGTAATAGSTRLTGFYKFAGPSESAVGTGDSGNHQCAVVLAFRDVATSGTFNANGGDTASASTSIAFPNVTTTVADCLIVNILAHAIDASSSTQSSGEANASLSSVTERFDQGSNAALGGGLAVITGGLASAGASGATTATLASSSAQARITLALAPPAGGTTVTVTAAAMAHAGQATTVNAKRNLVVTAGAVAFAGQAVAVNVRRVVAMASAGLVYAGQVVTVVGGGGIAVFRRVGLRLGLGLGI